MATTTLSATGSSDHTPINAAITAATAGDTLYFLNGTYDLGAVVSVTKALTLEGESQDGVVFKSAEAFTAGPILLVNGYNDVTVKNMTFDGNGAIADNENQGPSFQKCNTITLQNVTSRNFRGHQMGIYGCVDVTLTNVTTEWASTVGTGTSHGLDIDSSFYAGVALSNVGTTCTATLGAGHNVVVDDYIAVQNATPETNYNGTWLVTAADATTVTFVVSVAPTGADTGDVGRDTKNLTITNSTFDNGWGGAGRQSFKASNINSSTVTNCTFNSQAVIATSEAAYNAGVTFDDCTFGHVVVHQRSANFSPTIQNSTFSRDAGAIQIYADTGANLVLDGNTFNGRNSWLGFNGTTWITPTKVTETNTYHPGKDGRAGKTVFACYNSTGSMYNVAPYMTPDMARNNLEDLVEDVNLDETDIHYALLSDRGDNVVDAADSNISFQAVRCITEGYPGTAVVDLSARTTGDFISGPLWVSGSVIRNLHIKNASVVGSQAIRFAGLTADAIGTIENCIFSDFTNAGVAGTGIDIQSSASGTASIMVRNCEFRRIVSQTSANGIVAYVKATTNPATLTFEGCKFDSNSTGGTSIVRCDNAAGTALHLNGCEITNNTSGATGVVYNQTAGSTINGCTFAGNTGTNEDDVSSTVAIAVKSSIFEDITADFGGAGAATFSNCMSAATITYDAATVDGGGNIVGSPTYVDSANGDYNLTSDALGVGTGAVWWTATNARPVGANGEPFPDRKVDIGANQSTHNAMHPGA